MAKPGYRRRFTLEVSLPELRAMRAAAGKAGMSTSAWLRTLVRTGIARAQKIAAKKAADADAALRSE